ncbi:MAG: beta-lactamase [Ilumatobacteraceae bacterium]|nr:beta-lactamase [Ilumatobacteraceae bacterium]
MATELFNGLARHVGSGALPGLIALGARGDDVTVEVTGTATFDDTAPLQRDAIFRLASLTKPIAAVAAMTMVDDGILRLDDIVDGWLPELANHRVLRTLASELDDTVPAARPITVEDLLTGQLGFGSIMAAPGTYPIQTAEVEQQLMTLTQPWPPTPLTNDEWIARLGALPFLSQPGEQWHYNTAAQVLGVLLERAAGAPLAGVLQARIFEPLGMVDTAFFVPAEKMHRLTTAYAPEGSPGRPAVLDRNDASSWWSAPPPMPSAASWLVSTIDDFWAFARMMANGGEHDGHRLLSKVSFEQMLVDHTTADQRAASTLFLGEHGGWGLGLTVPAAGDPVHGDPPGFGWDGGTGTTWRTDPDTGRTGIMFTQRAMTSPEPPVLFDDFWACIATM